MRNWWVLTLVLVACERPFVETSEPLLQVIEPDLSQVLTTQIITLRVQSTHFRPVEGVTLNGVAMNPSPLGPGYWEISLGLRLGINPFFLTANDQDGVSRMDTTYAIYLPHSISSEAPSLPQPRGGHSVVRLRNGSLMVSGGTFERGGTAQGESFLLRRDSQQFTLMEQPMITPRTGHTAILLPDRRVLIAGGSRVDEPTRVSDLVETVELFDPTATVPAFTEIPVNGQPIRRMHHSAIIRESSGALILDLMGGFGDVRYGSDPQLGVRQDMRSFQIESQELVALNTEASAPLLFEPVSQHTVTPTKSDSYILLGSQFRNSMIVNANMNIRYPRASGLSFSPLVQFITPRTAHSTAALFAGLYGIFGGTNESNEIPLTIGIFHEPTERFFTLTPSRRMVARYDHTAISAGLRSVLIVGGFSANGTAITTSEYLRISFQ